MESGLGFYSKCFLSQSSPSPLSPNQNRFFFFALQKLRKQKQKQKSHLFMVYFVFSRPGPIKYIVDPGLKCEKQGLKRKGNSHLFGSLDMGIFCMTSCPD